MAAAVTLLGSATFNTTSGTHTVTATPAVNDLIVIVGANTGSVVDTTPTDDNSGGAGAYTRITGALKASSADELHIFVRTALVSSASSTVFTLAPGTTTGGGLAVLKVTGMTQTGAAAVVQSAIQDNIASGVPTPVLGATPAPGNPIIGAAFTATNPAALTPRAAPVYTERVDTGWASPTTGIEIMSINAGETGTSIAWGSSSSTAFCSLVVELNYETSPTVALNTPTDASSDTDTTPTFDFTGTDVESDSIRYQIQIDNDSDVSSPLLDKVSGTDLGFSNPDFVEYNESMAADTTTGTKLGSAAWNAGGYLILNPATNFTDGEFEYSANLAQSFETTFDVWSGGGSGADSIYLYWGATATVEAENATQANYAVVANEFSDLIELRFNGTVISSVAFASLDNSTWRTIKVDVAGNHIRAWVDTVLKIDYTDITRSLGGNLFGWGARSGGTNNQHRVRNLLLQTKTDPYVSADNVQYTVQAGDALAAGTYYWRVRGIDPYGYNVYGAWSSIRSFTVTGAGVNKSDSITVTESISVTLVSVVNKSESILVSEYVDILRAGARDVQVSDSITVSESVSINLPIPELPISVSESITVSESIKFILVSLVSNSESISLTDTPTVLRIEVDLVALVIPGIQDVWGPKIWS